MTVWDDNTAQDDAQKALDEWYSACPGIQKQECCVRVFFDQNALSFSNVDYKIGSSDPIEIALTPLPSCHATSCPDSNSLFIRMNVSDKFLFASNAAFPVPDSNYPQSVSSRTLFTGPSAPSVNPGFETFSFRYTIEHELGHWFGFEHSTDGNCDNNVDSCGSPSVMEPSESNNIDPIPVTCEDLNMFRKLYCPDQPCQDCAAGVSEATESQNLKAEIFPNPTTGASLLQYQITNRSMVQVAIFDVLGNQIRTVTSGYEESGLQSVSLGTESLPAGNYICRINVGNNVTSINLVIKK